MPSSGSIGISYASGTTGEVKEFAGALRGLIDYVCPGAAMALKARALRVSPAQLSHWLHGRRLPSVEALRLMCELAAQGGGAATAPGMRGLGELEALLCAARRSTGRCPGGHTCSEGDRRNRAEAEGDRRNRNATEGDRRNAATHRSDLGGRGGQGGIGSALPGRLAEMGAEGRITLLRSLAASLKEEEIACAANVLARAGLKGEMEALIRYAELSGKRSVEIAVALGAFY